MARGVVAIHAERLVSVRKPMPNYPTIKGGAAVPDRDILHVLIATTRQMVEG
jgi:hypothetical protein